MSPFHIRAAKGNDFADMAKVRVDTWKATYKEILSGDFLENLSYHAENPYRRFYESLGGKMVKEKTNEIGGKLISEVGYGWEEITTFVR